MGWVGAGVRSPALPNKLRSVILEQRLKERAPEVWEEVFGTNAKISF